MTMLVDPPFSHQTAASPQRSRLQPLQLAMARLSYEVSDFGKQTSKPTKKSPQKPEPKEEPRKQRFSLFGKQKKTSIVSSLLKLMAFAPRSNKTYKTPSPCHIFDMDDGLLDDGDVQLGLAQCEGGIPLELVTSPLRITYLLSVRKLKVYQNRPLHQLLLINDLVSRLKLRVVESVPSLTQDPLPHFTRLSPPPIRRRPVMLKRYSLSEPSLLPSSPPLTRRASRSEETLSPPPKRSPHRLSVPCF
ncbi:hypothetical protein DSO57_1014661 [Entomophthora muscae]|uniref:Uncharacterized protein n=1 Tax=Entomophthora muscae TaxID=34485 RepID=A0ACC2RWL7_9FUNG|nr:hypothetical protein DSO57_1014661 [Entomophthora muscae]